MRIEVKNKTVHECRNHKGPESTLTVEEKSKRIEAVLAGVPIPSMMVNAIDKDETILNVDHTLSILQDFVAGKFDLQGLALLPTFNGVNFDSLARHIQRTLLNAPVVVHMIYPGTTPEELQYVTSLLR